jgi:hypothetical protein
MSHFCVIQPVGTLLRQTERRGAMQLGRTLGQLLQARCPLLGTSQTWTSLARRTAHKRREMCAACAGPLADDLVSGSHTADMQFD